MPDYFALLDQPRRPWLDADALKAKFLALSSATHPDRVHGAAGTERLSATQRYTELNSAHACLREPKDRLQHLLELERGQKLSGLQRTPDGVMELFMQVGELVRAVDAFLVERARVASPMLKVRFFEQGLDWVEKVRQLQQTLHARREGLYVELRVVDLAWEKALPVGDPTRAACLPLEPLEQIYRQLSYLERWSGQLQDRFLRLSL